MSNETFTEGRSRGDIPTLPEVYKYLGKDVPTQDLVGYIFQHFYRAPDAEALCLCFDELLSRGFVIE